MNNLGRGLTASPFFLLFQPALKDNKKPPRNKKACYGGAVIENQFKSPLIALPEHLFLLEKGTHRLPESKWEGSE